MASRRKSRILAFQAIYAWDITGNVPGGCVPGGNVPGDNVPVENVPVDSVDETPAGVKPGKEPKSTEDRTSDEPEMPDFTRLLVSGTIENIKIIDDTISKHLENWDFSRVKKVDLAVLRISVYALIFQNDTAPSIIINEAISISKEYGTDDSYRFVNGVLDAIRKTLAEKSV